FVQLAWTSAGDPVRETANGRTTRSRAWAARRVSRLTRAGFNRLASMTTVLTPAWRSRLNAAFVNEELAATAQSSGREGDVAPMGCALPGPPVAAAAPGAGPSAPPRLGRWGAAPHMQRRSASHRRP